MGEFVAMAFGWPTAVYTTLLGVVLFYWVLAIAGIVDFEHGQLHVDHDVHLDGDAGDVSTFAQFLVAMGLNGVPFSVVVSLLVLIGWVFCSVFATWLLPLVPTAPLRAVAGAGGLVGAMAGAIPVAAQVVRPMRRLFVTHNAISNAELVGQTCRILTGTVDGGFGRAEVAARGASYNIRVYATAPNALTKGSVARIVEYDPARERYLVVADA